MNPFSEERRAQSWALIKKAIDEGMASTIVDKKEPLARIVTVADSSRDLSDYVEYLSAETPLFLPGGMTISTLAAVLPEVYELSFTVDVTPAWFDADGALNSEAHGALHDFGVSIRMSERNWVLDRLIDGADELHMLAPNDPLLARDIAVRIIPFNGTDADPVEEWPIAATVTISSGTPGPAEMSVMVVPITGGPLVKRIHDVDLEHTLGAGGIVAEAVLRYQLLGFGTEELSVGATYTEIASS